MRVPGEARGSPALPSASRRSDYGGYCSAPACKLRSKVRRITQKAVLGFHAPRWVDGQGRQYAAKAETRIFVATYPAPVRAWIERHGGLTSKLILLRGWEMTSMFPRCS